jgi:hypothetical protein
MTLAAAIELSDGLIGGHAPVLHLELGPRTFGLRITRVRSLLVVSDLGLSSLKKILTAHSSPTTTLFYVLDSRLSPNAASFCMSFPECFSDEKRHADTQR